MPRPFDHDLHVIDLKLGKGIEVSATENPQEAQEILEEQSLTP